MLLFLKSNSGTWQYTKNEMWKKENKTDVLFNGIFVNISQSDNLHKWKEVKLQQSI